MNLFNPDGSVNQLLEPSTGINEAAKINRKDLVDFFITKGTNNWNWGMWGAAYGGHLELVDFFITKGANDWNWGMWSAAKGGSQALVDFFITKGANYWNWGMGGAAQGGHQDLVDFFKQKLDSPIQLLDYIGSETCSICQNEIFADSQTPCLHIFHRTCITEWYHIQKTCPVCRRNI